MDLTLYDLTEYLYEALHFVLRTVPVFGGEGEKGEVVDAVLRKSPDDAAKILRTGVVALGS